MLKLTIEPQELFNEATELFTSIPGQVVEFEHSLVSLSKWESKFGRPFLSSEKTIDETLFYIECMVISPGDSPVDLRGLTPQQIDQIKAYVDSSQSATTFGSMPERKGRGEVVTSELIYYWMVAYNIPFECESWHLNRLFSLIRICNLKQSKPTPKGRAEARAERARLNAERREKWNTKG